MSHSKNERGPRSHWHQPVLDRYEDLLVERRNEGASLRDLQRMLRVRKCFVSVSTIRTFLKTLPRSRFVKFQGASPKLQAQHWIKKGLALGQPRHGSQVDGKIHSVGTMRTYQGNLTRYSRWLQQNKGSHRLDRSTPETAGQYLIVRSRQVAQKTLDLDRQSIQYLHRQLTGNDVRLKRVKSTYRSGRQLATEPRAYSRAQLEAVCGHLSDRSALSARICVAAGLRAHELATVRRVGEAKASEHREWSQKRFTGRIGVIYTVAGKGGLRREVLIPNSLANELEQRRLPEEHSVRDRGVNYRQVYDLAHGRKMSVAWTNASRKALGWSAGLHGLRHSYAQERMLELRTLGFAQKERKSIVSQELGHFRTKITEVYLR